MLRVLMFAATVALSSTAAHAACSTAALAGNWVVIVPEGICTATVATNGNVTGGCGKGKLTLSKACKIAGSLYGHPVTGRTDNQANTKNKPTVWVGDAAGMLGVMAYRK
jgi:hypothetical protein